MPDSPNFLDDGSGVGDCSDDAQGGCAELAEPQSLSCWLEHILDDMPDGVVVLDSTNIVRWSNKQFRQWTGIPDVCGRSFYSMFNGPEILGPDFCPFHTALATGQPSGSRIRTAENRYFHVHATPSQDNRPNQQNLIVTIRDVTQEMLQQQKITAIHKAGVDLANLKPVELLEYDTVGRVELLKSNILHYTQDLLKFDVVEIRLLDLATGALSPLLSVGLDEEAAVRPLWAKTENNGVTGFVAATGQSYLCEDTQEDPLYLQGFQGAKSSLTVPLILHEKTIGTFNVESPEPRAFTENDLQFLEIFSRAVAVALNTLELLVTQKVDAALSSVEAIHGAVALPVDEILNDTCMVVKTYQGDDKHVHEQLQRIQKNARHIKEIIQDVGKTLTPSQAVPLHNNQTDHPKLMNRRVLVVDIDLKVRNDAHAILEKYGCIVETAHTGEEATAMVRNAGICGGYDAIISEIHLPDMNGFELMTKLKDLIAPLPLILMKGYGYDSSHVITNARQAGLHPKGSVFKPFRVEQLLESVEAIIEFPSSGTQA